MNMQLPNEVFQFHNSQLKTSEGLNKFRNNSFFFTNDANDCFIQNRNGSIFKVNIKNDKLRYIWDTLNSNSMVNLIKEYPELKFISSLMNEDKMPKSKKKINWRIDKNYQYPWDKVGDSIGDSKEMDIVVAISGVFNKVFFEEVNLTTSSNIPWIPIYFDGRVVRIGPVFNPKVCYECFIKRVLAASPDAAITKNLWKKLNDEQMRKVIDFSQKNLTWLNNTLATLFDDISQIPIEKHSILEHQLSLDVDNQTKCLTKVLKVPGCPVCDKEEINV
jgi:bacteriocin biosynthesis cyclodehydratase domain-containing protein